VQIFCAKAYKRTTLPQAMLAFRSDTKLEPAAPRKSCSQKNSRCEFFCEQDMVSSALPEAEMPFGSVNA